MIKISWEFSLLVNNYRLKISNKRMKIREISRVLGFNKISNLQNHSILKKVIIFNWIDKFKPIIKENLKSFQYINRFYNKYYFFRK